MKQFESKVNTIKVNEVRSANPDNTSIEVGDFVELKSLEDYEDTSYMTHFNKTLVNKYGNYVCEVLKVSDEIDENGRAMLTVVTGEGDILVVKPNEIRNVLVLKHRCNNWHPTENGDNLFNH